MRLFLSLLITFLLLQPSGADDCSWWQKVKSWFGGDCGEEETTTAAPVTFATFPTILPSGLGGGAVPGNGGSGGQTNQGGGNGNSGSGNGGGSSGGDVSGEFASAGFHILKPPTTTGQGGYPAGGNVRGYPDQNGNTGNNLAPIYGGQKGQGGQAPTNQGSQGGSGQSGQLINGQQGQQGQQGGQGGQGQGVVTENGFFVQEGNFVQLIRATQSPGPVTAGPAILPPPATLAPIIVPNGNNLGGGSNNNNGFGNNNNGATTTGYSGNNNNNNQQNVDQALLPSFLLGASSESINQYMQIGQNQNLTKDQIMTAQDQWAYSQPSNIQVAYQQAKAAQQAQIAAIQAAYQQASVNLSPEGKTLFNQVQAILNNGSLTRSQERAQIAAAMAQATEAARNELTHMVVPSNSASTS